MSDIAEFSSLVSDIYDAAMDISLYPMVMERIKQYLRADLTVMLSEDVMNNVGRIEFNSSFDLDWMQLYFERYMHINPVRAPSLPFVNAGDTFNTLTYVTDEEFRSSLYYKEWFRQKGLLDTVSTILERSSMNFALLSVIRREEQGYATIEDFDRINLIAPHVRRSVSISHVVAMKTFEIDQFKEVFDKTAAAVLFVQSNGSIIYANPSAEALCADGTVIVQRHRRLVAVDDAANGLLASALSAAGDPGRTDCGAAILLSGPPMRHIAHILPMSSGRRASAGTRIGAVAVVFIRQAGLVIPTAAAELSHLYNLTPRELTVLMSIVAENNVAQTAAILGLSPHTVKTHLKAIFRKTDVNTQSELATLTAGIANPFLPLVA